jgi:ribonuclease P protein component
MSPQQLRRASGKPAAPKRFKFPKSARLLRPLDFQRAYKRGRRLLGDLLVVFCVRAEPRDNNARPVSRLGICASNKIGDACARNRAKRLVREAWRLVSSEVAPGWDVVVNCRSAACRSNFRGVDAALRALCVEAGLLPKSRDAIPPPAPPSTHEREIGLSPASD